MRDVLRLKVENQNLVPPPSLPNGNLVAAAPRRAAPLLRRGHHGRVEGVEIEVNSIPSSFQIQTRLRIRSPRTQLHAFHVRSHSHLSQFIIIIINVTVITLCRHCRFSDTFDGVVLAYNVKSLDPCSKIIPGITPYFGVKLKVDLLLFSPKPDTLLGTILISHSVVVVVIRTCESINRVCVFFFNFRREGSESYTRVHSCCCAWLFFCGYN